MKISTSNKSSTSSLSAVVVAAGQSQRFRKGLSASEAETFRSKALMTLHGKPMIVKTLAALSALPLQEIVVVVSEVDRLLFENVIDSHRALTWPAIKICIGGETRKDSVRLGLEALAPVERVCIHDGARPFVSENLLNRLNEASKACPSAIPVLTMVDTIKEINADGSVLKTHNRASLVRVQTPQFFKWREILDAHRSLEKSSQDFTDDAAIFEALGLQVMTVEGDIANIKVTTVEDLLPSL